VNATADPPRLPGADARLRELQADVDRQLRQDAGVSRPWVHTTDGVHPVLVVGAGQAGLTLAQGLRRSGVDGVLVVDAGAAGATGSWSTYARMRTLRTPKDLRWPCWNVPASHPRQWFEAVHGTSAWAELEHFPTRAWFAFLEFYRTALRLDVTFSTSVQRVSGGHDGEPFQVALQTPRGAETVRARHVVLATGLEGSGGRRVPDVVRALPANRWAHSHDPIDFAALAGARIGVLGGGTGAFDNAATALEAGARSVEVHMRRAEMPTVSPYRWMEFAGLVEHYASFTDEQKWLFNAHLSTVDQPATQNAVWRAHALPGFSFHRGSPWHEVGWDGTQVVVRTPAGRRSFDFVIAATGVDVDLAARPELREVADAAARWSDRIDPELLARTGPTSLQDYPYLTDSFGLTGRDRRDDERLGRLHVFNHGARMSLGVLSHQVSGLSGGVERLTAGIGRALFAHRSAELLADFLAYDTPAGVLVGPRPGQRTPVGVLSGG
jgi:cation diffusion facilitator CzcD-associated flavoprotein CzcO